MAKKAASAASTSTVRITQVRSTIGYNKSQAKVMEGLGLRRIGHAVELKDTPSIRGMIHKVRHLVEVEGAETSTAGAKTATATKKG